MSDRSIFGQTETSVHSMTAMRRLRRDVFARDQYALTGVCLYAQLLIGVGLYLYGHVSTPGYLSVLLALPAFLAVYFLSLFLAGRRGKGRLDSAAGRALYFLLGVVSLLDAQLAMFALCAVLSDILPNISPFWGAVAIALITALSVGGGDEYALSRLARLLRWGLLAALLYAAAGAVPSGNVGHLFPLLGYGWGIIGRGALWMSGCAAGCCFPLIQPRDGEILSAMRGHWKAGLRNVLFPVLLAAAAALLSAYLMPVYALARPETLGFRLLLISHMNPSLLGWSLLVCGTMFLLLLALAAGVLRGAALFACAAGRKNTSPLLITVLLLLPVPAAALGTVPVEEALLVLAPWRGAAAVIALLLMLLLSFLPSKEAAK